MRRGHRPAAPPAQNLERVRGVAPLRVPGRKARPLANPHAHSMTHRRCDMLETSGGNGRALQRPAAGSARRGWMARDANPWVVQFRIRGIRPTRPGSDRRNALGRSPSAKLAERTRPGRVRRHIRSRLRRLPRGPGGHPAHSASRHRAHPDARGSGPLLPHPSASPARGGLPRRAAVRHARPGHLTPPACTVHVLASGAPGG